MCSGTVHVAVTSVLFLHKVVHVMNVDRFDLICAGIPLILEVSIRSLRTAPRCLLCSVRSGRQSVP